jgi:hypothetical protein
VFGDPIAVLVVRTVRAQKKKSACISTVIMSNSCYRLLKRQQRFKGSGTVNTHRGVDPTRGSWLFPNYAVDSTLPLRIARASRHIMLPRVTGASSTLNMFGSPSASIRLK